LDKRHEFVFVEEDVPEVVLGVVEYVETLRLKCPLMALNHDVVNVDESVEKVLRDRTPLKLRLKN
jgi:hypothetical protein